VSGCLRAPWLSLDETPNSHGELRSQPVRDMRPFLTHLLPDRSSIVNRDEKLISAFSLFSGLQHIRHLLGSHDLSCYRSPDDLALLPKSLARQAATSARASSTINSPATPPDRAPGGARARCLLCATDTHTDRTRSGAAVRSPHVVGAEYSSSLATHQNIRPVGWQTSADSG
jgi:hypothetical protein